MTYSPPTVGNMQGRFPNFQFQGEGLTLQGEGPRPSWNISIEEVKKMIEKGSYEKHFHWKHSDGERAEDFLFEMDVNIRLTFNKEPGILKVSPQKTYQIQGPDKKGKYSPSKKQYSLKNVGKSTIDVSIKEDIPWLETSIQQLQLGPEENYPLELKINEKIKKLKEGKYTEKVQVINQTNNQGSYAIPIEVTKGEDQLWELKIKGWELADRGGYPLTLVQGGKKQFVTLKFGVKYHFDVKAQARLIKKKGHWVFDSGKILDIKATPKADVDQTAFDVKSTFFISPTNYKTYIGNKLNGTLIGSNTLQMYWPIPNFHAYLKSKHKLENIGKGKNTSYEKWPNIEFVARFFFDRLSTHKIPLKESTFKMKPVFISGGSLEKYKLGLKSATVTYTLKKIR